MSTALVRRIAAPFLYIALGWAARIVGTVQPPVAIGALLVAALAATAWHLREVRSLAFFAAIDVLYAPYAYFAEGRSPHALFYLCPALATLILLAIQRLAPEDADEDEDEGDDDFE